MLLACDPGKHACGLALFGGQTYPTNRLIKACYVKTEDLAHVLGNWAFDRFVIERQYLTPKHPRPQDIVELAYAAGRAEGIARVQTRDITELQPIRWKGNVPKAIMTARILAKLDQTEVARIEKVGYKDHNTIDAIGIGLYALGRLT